MSGAPTASRRDRRPGGAPRPPAVSLEAWIRDVLKPRWDPSELETRALTDHAQCGMLSGLFRGTLCAQLARRPGRRLPAGRHAYRQGDESRSVFLMRTGLVKTSVLSPSGGESTLRVHRPGDIFGELCLCTGARRDQATALEASEVVEIPLAALLAQLQRDPHAALDFATLVCERLAEAYDQLRSLAADPVLARLVRTLLQLADAPGVNAPSGEEIARSITQEELARMVGARREVVSGLLNRLRERGLISYTRRGPIRVSRSALQAFVRSLGTE